MSLVSILFQILSYGPTIVVGEYEKVCIVDHQIEWNVFPLGEAGQPQVSRAIGREAIKQHSHSEIL